MPCADTQHLVVGFMLKMLSLKTCAESLPKHLIADCKPECLGTLSPHLKNVGDWVTFWLHTWICQGLLTAAGNVPCLGPAALPHHPSDR